MTIFVFMIEVMNGSPFDLISFNIDDCTTRIALLLFETNLEVS